MKSQFHVDCGPGSTTHESHEAIPAIEANRQGNTWEFVSGLQRLLGDDAEPDPLFFVESWTVGVPVAVENWQKRRQVQKGRERQHRVFSECVSLGVQSIARQSELGASLALSSGADAKTARYNVRWSQHFFEKSPSQFKASQEWKPFAEVADGGRAAIHPMSKLRAFELLEVNPASTRRQIKAAYRRMVNQIHPDRLEHRTEGVRRLANDQMAEINEAYHLLCNGLL